MHQRGDKFSKAAWLLSDSVLRGSRGPSGAERQRAGERDIDQLLVDKLVKAEISHWRATPPYSSYGHHINRCLLVTLIIRVTFCPARSLLVEGRPGHRNRTGQQA